MKFEFKVGNVEIKEIGLALGAVEVKVEYSLEEAKGAYNLYRTAIKEMPEILTEVKTVADKFQELDKEFNAKWNVTEVYKNDVAENVVNKCCSEFTREENLEEDAIHEELVRKYGEPANYIPATDESIATVNAVSDAFDKEFPIKEEQMGQVNGVIADIKGFFRKIKEEGIQNK